MIRTIFGIAALSLALTPVVLAPAASGQPTSGDPAPIFNPDGSVRLLVVSREDLRRAMDKEVALDYSAFTTTNSARFFADVVLMLAREAQEKDPHGPPLLFKHEDWYDAFLDAVGIDRSEAPIHVRLAYQYKQDVLIDYDIDAVVKSVKDGPDPLLAVSVQLGWPESLDLGMKYSYEDTLSKPHLQITNHRLIQHRLLDFGDIVSYDEVDGMTGRPTTGIMAAIFKLFGEGRINWSRIFIADNGVQVTRGSASKGPFSVVETVHVLPDGTGDKGLPAETEKWEAIERRLAAKPKVEYKQWRLPDFSADW
ncbi:MAG: hypothetical protein KDD65_05825 [Bacteroidetes bacterium]|nr:hypothetical protein [Bacteroidota bacterium]